MGRPAAYPTGKRSDKTTKMALVGLAAVFVLVVGGLILRDGDGDPLPPADLSNYDFIADAVSSDFEWCNKN